jgi:hypothetical protein
MSIDLTIGQSASSFVNKVQSIIGPIEGVEEAKKLIQTVSTWTLTTSMTGPEILALPLDKIHAAMSKLAVEAAAAANVQTIRDTLVGQASSRLRALAEDKGNEGLAALSPRFSTAAGAFSQAYTALPPGISGDPAALIDMGGEAVEAYRTARAASQELDGLVQDAIWITGMASMMDQYRFVALWSPSFDSENYRERWVPTAQRVGFLHTEWDSRQGGRPPLGLAPVFCNLEAEMSMPSSVDEWNARISLILNTETDND